LHYLPYCYNLVPMINVKALSRVNTGKNNLRGRIVDSSWLRFHLVFYVLRGQVDRTAVSYHQVSHLQSGRVRILLRSIQVYETVCLFTCRTIWQLAIESFRTLKESFFLFFFLFQPTPGVTNSHFYLKFLVLFRSNKSIM
jgi:hypothetical protein